MPKPTTQSELRELQRPIKDRYREDPTTAEITLSAAGSLEEGISCSVDTGRALVEAGLHPGTGGDGSLACSGDMLLQALVACAGVTMRSVATAMGLEVSGTVHAEGDLDWRGTMAVDKGTPVGFREIRLRFDVESDASAEELATLERLTERYCVVFQTLAAPPVLEVSLEAAGAMSATITVPGSFNGPLDSGNGGYSAGALAAFVDGIAEVSLRSPVPLDRPLEVAREDDGSARVLDGETLVAQAKPVAALELDVPAPVSVEAAREASARYRGTDDGPFSRCFVCGRARGDAWGVFAGAVEGRDVVASPWTPPESAAGADGNVRAGVHLGGARLPDLLRPLPRLPPDELPRADHRPDRRSRPRRRRARRDRLADRQGRAQASGRLGRALGGRRDAGGGAGAADRGAARVGRSAGHAALRRPLRRSRPRPPAAAPACAGAKLRRTGR